MRRIEDEFSSETKQQVEQQAGGCCMVCGHPLKHGNHHHDIQMQAGGTGAIENDIYVCPPDKNVCHTLLDSFSEQGIYYKEVMQVLSEGIMLGIAVPKKETVLFQQLPRKHSFYKKQKRRR